MTNNPKFRIMKMAILATLLVLIFVNIILSFDFSPVDLLPGNATTTDSLICTWSSGGVVNVTWYNNSVQYGSPIPSASNPQSIPSYVAKRGQTWQCTVVEANDSLNILSDSVIIKNSYPLPPAIVNQTLDEDQPFSYTLTSTDADGDTIRFPFYESDTITLDTFNPVSGYFTWLPTQSNIGLHNISFYCRDDEFVLIGKSVFFNVTAVNDRPTFTAPLTNKSINENETLQVSVAIYDEESAVGPFLFSANSSYYPPLEKIGFNSSDNNKSFLISFSPNNRKSNYSDIGNYTIWVRACDPQNISLCVNGSFNLEVKPINHIPVITLIPNASGIQNENFTLYINASDIDVSDSLQFSVSTIGCSLSNPWTITTLNNSNNASAVINVTPLTNTHIVCRNITVSVTDTKATVTQNIYLNLTNVNDYPIIYNLSYYIGNTHSNINISNLYAYRNSPFVYKVNGTDIDLLVNQSETLTYGDNSSLCSGNCPTFTLNATSGIITLLPDGTLIGNYSYKINLTDQYGLTATAILYLHTINNTNPYFNQSPSNRTAYEDLLFTYKLNATDLEGSFDTFSINTNMFNISSTGLINFTPTCSQTGNWTITIKINDTVGAYNETSFNLEIIPTGDAPLLPVVANMTILEEMPFYMDLGLQTTDGDLSCGQADTLTYTSRFLSGQTLFNISTSGIVSFTPNTTSEGTYMINISVIDSFGLRDNLRWNLTIFNRTNPPVIHNITPYGTPTLVIGWKQLSVGEDYTNINITENITLVYDHNSTDQDDNPLVFNWTIDGVVSGSSKNLSHTWGFSTYGNHNVTLKVYDNVYGVLAHEVKFSWNMSISRVNRPPILNNSLPNVSLNGTAMMISNYLTGVGWGAARFTDPDNDILTYTYTIPTKATVSVQGDSVIFTPLEVGLDSVVFTASDGEYFVSSNNVTINVTEIEEDEGEDGGVEIQTRTKTSTSYIPYSVIQEVEKEKEVYFDILVPQPLVLYKNETLREVINLVNSGNVTLRGIYLSAGTNSTDAKISFSTNYFPELLPGETKKTDLILTAYRLLNHYEIIIWANISDPAYKDKVVIYANALEKSRGNQSVTATKITFAQDLLNSNPECLELNEFLKQAEGQMEIRDYEEASNILNSVIQGCKYLVTQSKLKDERPAGWIIGIDLDSTPYLKPTLILFTVIMIAAIIMTIRTRKKNQEDSL